MDPIALTELIPDWKEKGAPVQVEVNEDRFLFLSETSSQNTPSWLLPESFKNDGNYIVRLGDVCKWLADYAESLEVDVFAGIAAASLLYTDDGAVRGVVTGDMGSARDGSRTANSRPGMELHAKYTLFAEGS